MEEFAANFHSLSGTTIGERRKNLFLLLNKTKQAGDSELDFTSIQPRTPLEERFLVETLIHFKRVPQLLKLLSSENLVLIEKVLKNDWFLQEALASLTGEQLVTTVFPYVSFNTKLKIINRLAVHIKDTRQADLFYEAIEKKYGSYLAAQLLPSCSSRLIVNCIKSNRIKPTPRMLNSIIEKYPELAEDLFKQVLVKIRTRHEYKKSLLLLARYNFDLFTKLCKEYYLPWHLGWRLTHKLIQANREQVVKNASTYHKFLHVKQIAKSLKQDFAAFYANVFPKSVEQFDNWSHEALALLKAGKVDVNLLFATFKSTYGDELWNHAGFVTPELLEMLTPDERQARLSSEYKLARMSDDEWNCFWKIDASIPYLKKRISLSSDIKMRAELVELLVKTCKLNEDKACLAEMCKYMVNRHRNDHITVRAAFLKAIKKRFKLDELEEQHWVYINELIKIFALNDEQFYHSGEYLEAYICFCLKKKLPIKEHLIEWIKTQFMNLNILKQKPKYEKECLLAFNDVIPEAVAEKDLMVWNMKFLTALIDWNKRHKNDCISLYDFTNKMQSFKEALRNTEYMPDRETVAMHCLRQKIDMEEKSNIISAYFSQPERSFSEELVNWLIKYDPLLVLQNIESLTPVVSPPYITRTNCFFFQFCKNYHHLKIPQKIVEISLSSLQKSDAESVGKNSMIALSLLMPPDEFFKHVTPYYPSALRVDTKSEDGKKTYKLQKYICLSLKYPPPQRALESITMFCKGDYFRLVRRCLYSVVGNVNEDKLVSFFMELLMRSLSVRKHTMHLAFRVLDKTQVCSMLNHLMETAADPSVCKFIFKCSFNFFVKNRSDYAWDLVKLNVNTVSIDKEIIGMLIETDKISQEYLVRYVLFTWDILSRLPDPDGDVETSKAILVNSFNSNAIQQLPQNFCEAIINENFLKSDLTYFQSVIQSFTCKYVIYCNSQPKQEERLKANFEVLKDYITKTWRNSDLRLKGHSSTVNLLRVFCGEFLDNNCKDKGVLVKFVNLWNGFLKPHEAFEEYLQLQLTLFYMENLDLAEIGQKIALLCDSLAQSYGLTVVSIISDKINSFGKYFLGAEAETHEEKRCTLVESFMKPACSVSCLLLALLLLANNSPTKQETKKKYHVMMERFEKNEDVVIQMYLHSYLKSIKI